MILFTGREPHPVIEGLPEATEQKLHRQGRSHVVEEFYKNRAKYLMMAANDPLRYGFQPDKWKVADKAMADMRAEEGGAIGEVIELDLGGNRACTVKGSLIYDPVTRAARAVEDVATGSHVWAWNGRETVVAATEAAFSRGVLDCVEVTTSDRQKFRCAKSHRVLTDTGWKRADALISGERLLAPQPQFASDLPRTTSDNDRQEWRPGAPHWTGTTEDSRSDCQSTARYGDAPLRRAGGTDQDAFPSRGDVLERRTSFGTIDHSPWRRGEHLLPDIQDDQERKHRHSLCVLGERPLAIWGDLHRPEVQFAGILSDAFCRPCRSASESLLGSGIAGADRQSTDASCLPRSNYGSDPRGNECDYERPCNHITTEIETVQEIGCHECWDFHVPIYENYVHAGVCHHNSKTERAARKVVELMLREPRSNVWCCQATETSSRQNQQSVIWKYLPPEFKATDGKGMRSRGITKVVFTQAGGFTENTFVLPNGSQCWFKFYSMNVSSLEGAELSMSWADELIPTDWVEALRYRLVTRNGLQLITFTPIEGYSQTVKMLLEGAETLEEMEAELLPIYDKDGQLVGHENVPVVQKIKAAPLRGRIIYFHTADNPFGNWPSMKEALKGANTETIKTRAYGVPTKSVASQFNFRSKVHVMSMNAFGRLVEKHPNGTRYMFCDPCSGRNWFLIWVFCPYQGKAIVYREWPSYGHAGAYIEGIGDPGPWAVPGGSRVRRENAKAAWDGDMGPAQEPFKFGLDRYCAEILKAENGEVIFERWMDCRYGNAAKTEREGTTTLIEQMADLGMDFIAATGEKVILGTNDGSIDMINSALYYDKGKPMGEYSPELGRINEPRLAVTENCPNTINALENWTGKDGQHGACKDPIDVIRMFYLSDLDYAGPETMAATAGGLLLNKMKVRIAHDDSYELPYVTSLENYGVECEVPGEILDRWAWITGEYNKITWEMENFVRVARAQQKVVTSE